VEGESSRRAREGRGEDTLNDTDLADEAKVIRLQDAHDQVHTGPRVVQDLDTEAAERLIILCGGESRPDPVFVSRDDAGRYWSLERKPGSILKNGDPNGVIWRRLWVPPLPDGGGDD
jgi:hypothetical protein